MNGVTIVHSAGARGPESKIFFKRLATKEKLMGLETEALLFESCKLCPEARDSGFQVLQQLFL